MPGFCTIDNAAPCPPPEPTPPDSLTLPDGRVLRVGDRFSHAGNSAPGKRFAIARFEPCYIGGGSFVHIDYDDGTLGGWPSDSWDEIRAVPCSARPADNAAPCPPPDSPGPLPGGFRVGERRRGSDGRVFQIVDAKLNPGWHGGISVEVYFDESNFGTWCGPDVAACAVVDEPPVDVPPFMTLVRRMNTQRDLARVGAAFAVLTEGRCARELKRRAIDALLAVESRPVRCAVLAALEFSEVNRHDVKRVPEWIADLHTYEAARARGMSVERAVREIWSHAPHEDDLGVFRVYERARSL